MGFLILNSCKNNEKRLEIGKAELLYENNISENQAKQMADFLLKEQYLNKEIYTSIGYKLIQDTFRLLLVVDRQYYIDTTYDINFRDLIRKGSEHLDLNKTLVLDICDRNYQIKRSIRN
jgi:hypothetical protein